MNSSPIEPPSLDSPVVSSVLEYMLALSEADRLLSELDEPAQYVYGPHSQSPRQLKREQAYRSSELLPNDMSQNMWERSRARDPSSADRIDPSSWSSSLISSTSSFELEALRHICVRSENPL